MADGGSEWRNEAGEEGGAMKGSTKAGGWAAFSAVEGAAPDKVGSGTRTAWPMRFALGDPKHQYKLKQPPHFLLCYMQ